MTPHTLFAVPGPPGEGRYLSGRPELCFSIGKPHEEVDWALDSICYSVKTFSLKGRQNLSKISPSVHRDVVTESGCLHPLLSSPVLSSSLCCLGSLRHSSESLTCSSFLVTGGVLGAVFNALNYWLTMFRIR